MLQLNQEWKWILFLKILYPIKQNVKKQSDTWNKTTWNVQIDKQSKLTSKKKKKYTWISEWLTNEFYTLQFVAAIQVLDVYISSIP